MLPLNDYELVIGGRMVEKSHPKKEIKVGKGDKVTIVARNSNVSSITVVHENGKKETQNIAYDTTIAFIGDGGAEVITSGSQNPVFAPRVEIKAPGMTFKTHTPLIIKKGSTEMPDVVATPFEVAGVATTIKSRKEITLKTPDNKLTVDENKGITTLRLSDIGTTRPGGPVKTLPAGRTLMVEEGARVRLVNNANDKPIHVIDTKADSDKIITDFSEQRAKILSDVNEAFKSLTSFRQNQERLGIPSNFQPLAGSKVTIVPPNEAESTKSIIRKRADTNKPSALDGIPVVQPSQALAYENNPDVKPPEGIPARAVVRSGQYKPPMRG